jgi:hypothetical protein
MPLVVLTYPGHFLLTVLTIRSYLEYHTPTAVIIVADDLSPYAWDSYLQDCQQLYDTQIIPLSCISQAQQFGKGWIRQQVAKLYLDTILKVDCCFFTDGDIVFLNPVDVNDTPYSIPDFSEVSQQQLDYVSRLLRINNPGIRVNGQLVCVSDPPFRTMHCQTLQQLRNCVGVQITQTGAGMSEWELIENFRHHVLGENLNLVRYAPHNIKNPDKKLDYFSHQFLTHYGTDRDLGQDFFDFSISDRVWSELSKISK